MNTVALLAITLTLFSAGESIAQDRVEYLLGSRESHTAAGHLRYLILLRPHYNPVETHELWINLQGSPGCASHAIFQYRQEALARGAILLAPEGTEGAGEYYKLKEGGRGEYHLWDMRRDDLHVLTILDEVISRYRIDTRRIVLLGFSAGCEMGWRLLAARPAQFSFFGGVANRFKRGRPPANEKGLRLAAAHVPHFYGAGKDDPFAGPMYLATAAKLRSYGFELRTAYPAGLGHDLPPSIKTPLVRFLDEVRARSTFASRVRSPMRIQPESAKVATRRLSTGWTLALLAALTSLFLLAFRARMRHVRHP
jgi:predicted esterase